MRDGLGSTFTAIASRLKDEGFTSPRGKTLSAEGVFSIYKKRKIRDERLNAPPELVISQIELIRPKGAIEGL